ncbi:MAG: endonuclease/exonuclease/phosphatase family protein [Dysgonamonadaceae bacterium]|jgi:endonuclease/exonuclease/phosphatase family metal-dependent hydrolase|nr:endonuclease/exonuclease/phosphatase family protein [Dysgonamonadaceae bacterium]
MRLKKIGKIFSTTIFVINVVTLFVFLLSAFSDRISPDSVMLFAYLGLAFPFFLFINILFAIWWIIVFRWKFLLVNIAVFIICFGQIFTYFPIHFRTKNVPDNCIKVLTYNVMRFNQYKNHTNGKPSNLISYILDLDADIVCLQEYGSNGDVPGLITEEDVDRIFKKKYPYRKVFPINVTKKAVGGNAIYSKFPIKSSKKIPYTSPYNGSFLVELNINGKDVTLINNHLESNKLAGKDLVEYAELMKGIKGLDSKKIEETKEFLQRKLSISYKIRSKQAELVSEYIKNSKTPYIIVCGDFNDTPISYARRTIKNGSLKDAFVETGSGMGITYNRNRFWVRIDYILHSKNIKAYNCTVGKLKDSDHYPVWTYLQLN